MSKFNLYYRFMDETGHMVERRFIRWHGDTSRRESFTVVYGSDDDAPSFTEDEVRLHIALLDKMCCRTSLEDDKSGAAFARQFVARPATP